jgi:hypothetical protein
MLPKRVSEISSERPPTSLSYLTRKVEKPHIGLLVFIINETNQPTLTVVTTIEKKTENHHME